MMDPVKLIGIMTGIIKIVAASTDIEDIVDHRIGTISVNKFIL